MIDMEETSAVEEVAAMQSSKGPRGEVGTASAAQTIKKLWHASGQNISLKGFARQLLKSDNKEQAQVSKEWTGNKHGAKNAKRSESNQIRVRAEASATKLGRKAKK
jgi:hypothetical protein